MMIEKEDREMLDYLINIGVVSELKNGRFSLREDARLFLEKMINDDPTLFKKIFPDRIQ